MARFLLHLVGDIHQPLHSVSMYNASLKTGDLGGRFYIMQATLSRLSLLKIKIWTCMPLWTRWPVNRRTESGLRDPLMMPVRPISETWQEQSPRSIPLPTSTINFLMIRVRIRGWSRATIQLCKRFTLSFSKIKNWAKNTLTRCSSFVGKELPWLAIALQIWLPAFGNDLCLKIINLLF